MAFSSLTAVSRALYERAFDATPIGKALVDVDGNCLRANSALERLLGAHPGGLVGSELEDAVGPGLLDRPLAVDAAFEEDREVLLPGGRTAWLRISVSSVHDTDEQPVGFVVQVQDITGQHELEADRKTLTLQLMRSNRELEEFASVASHDLQEPLRKIRAFADRLVTRHSEHLGDGAVDLGRIQDAAARMQVLIDGVLAYSRLDRRPLATAPVDLSAVVAAGVADFESRLREIGGAVSIGALPTVDGEPGELRQLVDNLISNAIKFHRPETPLQIAISFDERRSTPREAVILFADNGIGFDPKYAEKVFSIFERLHGRSEYPGTGIGLAICRKIVGRHGGAIHAEATVGHGATLVVTLPLAESPRASKDDGRG